jgi:2-polyprenyl-3-methyl-5-hydroxy-6-metoxy-1,4-benzoquinol methylase
MSDSLMRGAQRFFDIEVRKHPSFLQFDRSPRNFLVPSEQYARGLLGDADRNLRVLDVGCGDGVDSIALAGDSNRVWAIDVATSRLRLAQANVGNSAAAGRVLPICMDAHQLAFADETFDLVVGNSVLLFLDKERFAKECLRVLKAGGRALFPNESMSAHPLLKIRRAMPGVRERESIARRLTIDQVEAMVRVFGGGSHREFYLTSVFLAPLKARFGHNRAVSMVTAAAYRVDALLLTAFPVLRRFCWISVVEFAKP